MEHAYTEERSGEAVEPSIVGLFPCSSSQQRFYFLQKLDPESVALNVAMKWRIKGAVTQDAIEHALRVVVSRHEILRTRFIDDDGEPRQEVLSDASVRLAVRDLGHLSNEAAESEAQKIGESEARQPFDLETAPLLRGTLVRLSRSEAILMLTFHHLVVDGWSVGIVQHEVAALLRGADDQQRLPDISLQYADYALWQQEFVASAAIDEQTIYWQRKLSDLPPFDVPGDKPIPPVRPGRGVIRSRLLGRTMSDRLEKFARNRSQTLFVVASAALGVMLHRRTTAAEIVIGTPVAGRNDPSVENLVGPLINTVVLRLPIRPDESFEDSLKHCGSVIQEALSNQDVPFEILVRKLRPVVGPSRTPFFSVNFTLQPANINTGDVGNVRAGDLEFVPLPSHSTGAQWPLSFFMVGREEGWRISCEGDLDIYEVASLDAMLAEWEDVFNEALETEGKVRNRKIVPVPATNIVKLKANVAQKTQSTPDENEIEAEIVKLWADLLKRSDIGPESDFFEIGGHSLLAMRATSRLGKALGLSIDVSSLFRNPTPRSWAAHLAVPAAPRNQPRAVAKQPEAARPIAVPVQTPAELLERQIVSQWQELFRRSDITPESDFFEVGGHSLLAMRAASRLSGLIGRSFDVRTLFKNPTPRLIAAEIMPKAGPVETRVGKADVTPIVALNDHAGFSNIARRLAYGRPMIDIGLAGIEKIEDIDIKKIADVILARIDEKIGDRPFALMGFCMVGSLCFELARHLQGSNRKVKLVIMVDSTSQTFYQRMSIPIRIFLSMIVFRETIDNSIKLLKMLWRGDLTGYVFLEHYGIFRRIGLAKIFAKLGIIAPAPPRGESVLGFSVVSAIAAARAKTNLDPYDGDVLAFMSSNIARSRPFDSTRGWKNVVSGRLTTIGFSGHHDTFNYEPSASEIATAIEIELAGIEGRGTVDSRTAEST